MTKKSGKTHWRRTSPSFGPGEWLKALGLAAAMGLLAYLAVFALPSGDGDTGELPLVINRLMSSNPAACYSVDGAYYDWLELKNISDAPVNLAGWKLTDSGDLRGAYTLQAGLLDPGESLRLYCAKRPEGYAGEEQFTGFALSKNGETLLLADPRQRIAALEVPALGRKDVFQRDAETGRYSGMPFYEALGLEADYTDSLTPEYDPAGVTISELMPANRTVLMDSDGDFSDWIELYNGSGAAVSLEGWALSDDDLNRRKWSFPARTLQPGEYLLVFASGKDRREAEGQLHANFKLSAKGETLRLYNAEGDAVSYVEYPPAETDRSFSRDQEGAITTLLEPSPGYPNTEAGARSARVTLLTNSRSLYINEVFARGEGDDWVEIYNAGDETADLSGMGLTDNPDKPRKWQFPEGAKLKPKGYAVIALTGPSPEIQWEKAEKKETPRFAADYTADFALSEGETVCLSTPKGKLLDRVKLPALRRGVSLGRAEGYGDYRYYTETTPGKANAPTSYGGVTADIAFSVPPGAVRQKQISLEMSSDPGARIYYTTDGSNPTADSPRYTAPLSLSANTFIKAVAVAEDRAPTEITSVTYIFGNHSLRLVSVMGKASQLIGERGVLNTGYKGESQVYVEIYEPDGEKLVGQSCAFELIGHHSRVTYPQKSFKLTARRATGDTRFRARLFSNREYDAVKGIVLRAGGQDVFQTKMRDSILTALAADTTVMYQETEPCVVYVNGRYWGLYNMREHIDAHSVAQFEGWSDPDGVLLGEGTGESLKDYRQVLSWVESHSLSKDSNVEKLGEMMDIENYLDYVILEMYTNNQDLNNVRFYCSPREDPRWKWVLFDLDLSFQLDRNNVGDWLKDEVGTITTQTTTPFRQLMRNDTVKAYFLTRFGQLLATTLSAESLEARIAARAAQIEPEMAANCKRWGWKTDTWERYVRQMRSYARQRPARLIQDLCKTFKLSDVEKQLYFGDALAKIE